MKHAIKTAILSASLLAASIPTYGAVQLRVSDGTPDGTVTVTDQDANDFNPLIGVVAYFGPVGTNWLTSFSTGASKPTLGTAASPHLDVNTFDVSSLNGGILTVELTDTGFTGVGPAVAFLGGVTDGSVNFNTYADGGNTAFGKAALVTASGATPSGPFSSNNGGNISAGIPYSITLAIVINHPVPGKTGLDAEFIVTPAPGSNCVQQADAGGQCSDATTHHALYLPGIATDFVFSPNPGSFVENSDGSAHISGTVVSKSDASKSFDVNVLLSGRTTTPPAGSPKKDLKDCAYSENGGSINTSTWYYYTNFTGTLTGAAGYSGALLTIVPTGPAFQVGFGANNKNLNFGASSWFIWTTVQQPSSGPVLPLTGQGDFNLDIVDCVTRPVTNCVQLADGGGQCSDSTTRHALYLPGIATDFVFSPVAGSFVEYPDGTALLTGSVVSSANPTKGFAVNVAFSGRTVAPPPGSPKKDLESCAYDDDGPVDTDTWHYYTSFTGTLTGAGDLAGAILTLTPSGPAFQVGVGANNKNVKFGASSWFIWMVAQQPSAGSPLPITGQGDFNLNLGDCPPAVAVAGASICGSVLKDCDANSSTSGESGLAGWTVRLKKGTNVVATTTTGSDGGYCFNGLASGSYSILIALPVGYKQTVDPDSTKDNKASIKLSTGQKKTGVKFGYTGTLPAVELVVTGPASANCGDTITYLFAVTNTGNTCFSGGLTVNSSLLGAGVFEKSSVAPGEGFTFTKTYVVKSSDSTPLIHSVTVIGDSPGSLPDVTANKSVSIAILNGCAAPIPTGFADVPGNGQVNLSWQASPGASSYKLLRSLTKGGPYTTVKSGITALTYTDTNVVNGVVYYYVVKSSRSAILSAPSSEVSSVPTGGLPSPFSTKDIGTVGEVGGAGAAAGTFIVSGSGANVSGTADEFRFVYQSASADCAISARVVSIQDADGIAKAGVMIRETLSSGSKHASFFLFPTNGLAFQHRSSTGGSTVTLSAPGPLPPYWLKVVRTGSLFEAYSSPNGVAWTLVGSQTVSMSSSVYIGLAVSSHDTDTLCTTTFDNVTATP